MSSVSKYCSSPIFLGRRVTFARRKYLRRNSFPILAA
jgi:hypothetical protein